MTHGRVVVMPGARMIRSAQGYWRFPLFLGSGNDHSKPSSGAISGGAARMRAIQTEYLNWRKRDADNAFFVLVTGGNEACGASRAAEAARQLVTKYRLPGVSVVAIESGGSTVGNAEATADYVAVNRNHLGEVTNIEIATNDYHMLRAWLMFSRAILRVDLSRDLSVSANDRARLEAILTPSLALPVSVKQSRCEAMAILKPYFSDLAIRFVPLVVEEVLANGGAGARRYATLLRQNKWVREAVRREHQGVIDLINGMYRQ